MTTSHLRFPLSWPAGWPKTTFPQRGKFKNATFDRARQQLLSELRKLGATNVTLSTNQPLRGDGQPYAARGLVGEPGVAVYFTFKGRPTAMAQDKYQDITSNVRSLAMALEGLRQMERHGGGPMLDKAFEGFLALPAPRGKRAWRDVLGFMSTSSPTLGEIEARYRSIAKERHPDVPVTGDEALFKELTTAYEEAVKERS